MKKNLVYLLVGLCLGLSACGSLKGATATPLPPTMEPTTTPEIFQPLPNDQRAFEAVREVLAKQLNVDPLTISLVDIQQVEWPDSCLGLAGPDEMCAQMITPGFLIHVKAGERVYEFHTDLTAQNIREKKLNK